METSIPALFVAAIFMLGTVLVGRGGFIGMDNVGLQVANSGGANLYAGFRTRQTATAFSLHGVRFTE